MSTPDLIIKLHAAIKADEEFAQWAAEQVDGDTWEQRGVRIVTSANRDRGVADYAIVECIDHIVRHDPARVLRQVAAVLKILEDHQPRAQEVLVWVEEGRRRDAAIAYEPNGTLRYTACPTCGGPDWDTERFKSWDPCPTVLNLAEAYGIEART